MAMAQPAEADDHDFHVITRDSFGDFIGAHKLFGEVGPGRAEVTYCGRRYFAYPSTVEWTELAGARGDRVAVERRDADGWQKICINPQEDTGSADLDLASINKTKEKRMRTKGGAWIDIVVQRRKRNPHREDAPLTPVRPDEFRNPYR